MKNKIFSLLFALLASTAISYANYVVDLEAVGTSLDDWDVASATLNESSSSPKNNKYVYDMAANASSTSVVIGQSGVQFIMNTTSAKTKAFSIYPGSCYETGAKNGMIKVLNTQAGDVIRIEVAAKGASAASFADNSGTYPINATAISTDLSLPAKGTDYNWCTLDFLSTGGDVTLKETAGGFRVRKVEIVQNSAPTPTPTPVTEAVISGASTTIVGQSVTLTCTAANATDFQWYLNSEAISGATDSTYSFVPSEVGSMSFTCSASNAYNATPVSSVAFVVTISAAPAYCGEIIKAVHTGAKTATLTGLISGSVDKNTQANGKLGSNDQYFGIKLASGSFMINDSLIIVASTPSSIVQIFSDKGTTMLNEGTFDDNNRYVFELTSPTEWIYLYRTTTAGSAMNPFVDYMAVHRPCIPENAYRVRFVDWDGSLLSTVYVEEGDSAKAPDDPYRIGYTFIGWDKTFDNITANTTVTAQYTINHYKVDFVDWDGSVLKSQNVEYGGAAEAPADPVRANYLFLGWDKPFNYITDSIVITAQYLSVSENQIVASGSCGTNLTWKLTGDSLLLISGTGEMSDMSGNYAPWFEYRYDIKSLIINEGVTSIGKMAFLGCANLSTVIIPNSVTRIEDYAFAGCLSLTQFTISEYITHVGARVFDNCPNLKRIDWNARSAKIGYHGNCENLTEFIIGASVDSIKRDEYNSWRIFDGGWIAPVASIIVPNTVKYVEEGAFYEHLNIEYHGSLSGAPWGALCLNGHVDGQMVYSDANKQMLIGCTSLQKDCIVIPSSVTQIGNLSASSAVEMIVKCATPPSPIDEYIYFPENLSLIHVPAGKKQTYQEAWGGNYIYAEPNETDVVTVVNDSLSWSYNAATKILKLIGYGKTPDWEMGGAPWCNEYKTIIDSVWIDPRITYLGNNAFYECTSLKSLTIPSTIHSMGYNLIKRSGVERLYFYANVSEVGIDINSGVISSSQGEWMVGAEHAYFPFSGANVSKSKLVIGGNIKVIPDYLFGGMTNVEEVVLPDSVIYIGNNAFEGCGLKSVYIPNSCKHIGEFAFAYNDLEELILPDSLLHIGKLFTTNNPRLTEITIPSNVTELCDSLFFRRYNEVYPLEYIQNIQKIHFAPNSRLKRVGKYAFSMVLTLTECNLPASVTQIDQYAFNKCTAYSGFKLPDSLKEIGSYAYNKTLGVDTLILPTNLRAIGDYAFLHSPLNHIYINDSLDNIGVSPFSGNTKLCFHANNLSIWCQKDMSPLISPLSRYPDYHFRFIDTAYFYVKDTLIQNTTLCIPNNVKQIHSFAFAFLDMHGVTLELGDSVTTINEYAFFQSKIKSLKTTKQLRSIGEFAFARNDRYENAYNDMDTVLLESGIVSIDDNSFKLIRINHLQYNVINFPYEQGNRIPMIVYNVDIMNDVRHIPSDFLRGQTDLRITSWSDSIQSIGASAFSNATIQSMPDRFPVGLEEIGAGAFANSTLYEMPDMYPAHLKKIGASAFSSCITYNMPDVLPAQLEEIGDKAFYNMTRYDSPSGIMNFPKGLYKIGESAFNGNNYIHQLNFAGRTQLYANAFAGCTNIDSIFCHSEVPAVCSATAFEGLDKFNCTLVVPTGSAALYQAATGWRDFYYIQEQAPNYYTVSFLNWDGSVLQSSPVAEGQWPEYSGETPTRPSTDEYSYMFAGWTPQRVAVTEDATYTAVYDSVVNTYSITIGSALNGHVTGAGEYAYGTSVELNAIPDYGYHFVQWSDSLTENPRTITLTQNMTLGVVFDVDRSGVCGHNLELRWEYNTQSRALTISGNGALTENYTFGVEAPSQMRSLNIEDGVTAIGDSAFYAMSSINHLYIGSDVASIGNYAFADCRNFDDITCYSTTPPAITALTFDNVGNKKFIYLFVPENSVGDYQNDTYWSEFYIKTPQAEIVTDSIENVIVEPTDSTAAITWPAVVSAETYELQITKDGEIVCTLIFNVGGQLIQIAFAPSRDGTSHTQQEQVAGFKFTVTGLTSNTRYGYCITSKDADDVTLDTKSGLFTTTGENQEGFEDIDASSAPLKVMLNGTIYILRDDKVYTLQGQEVK